MPPADPSASGCPLVLVEWEDSARPDAEWRWLDEVGEWEPVRCVSVGWLLRRDAAVVALAPNMGGLEEGERLQVSGVIRIPGRAVTRVVGLEEVS